MLESIQNVFLIRAIVKKKCNSIVISHTPPVHQLHTDRRWTRFCMLTSPPPPPPRPPKKILAGRRAMHNGFRHLFFKICCRLKGLWADQRAENPSRHNQRSAEEVQAPHSTDAGGLQQFLQHCVRVARHCHATTAALSPVVIAAYITLLPSACHTACHKTGFIYCSVPLVNIFRAVQKIAKKSICFVISICLSARPHGTARLPVDRFWWNSVFEYF